jgi:hypothetical protein
MRIATLFVRHGTQKYATALDDLKSLLERRLPNIHHTLIVIDNSLPPSHHEETDGVVLIGGSNAAWEFSAWDSGIAYLGARLGSFDFIHLATSAFREHYIDYLERFDERMLSRLRGRAAAVGHIDFYNAPVSLFGRISQSWIRSSFLFLPPTEVRLLGSFVSVADGKALFSDDSAEPFRLDAPLSASYRENIIGWLTGGGTGQDTIWHSRFDLSPERLALFRAKTLAILNEHALAIRLRAQGCVTVDATWLANEVAAAKSGEAFPRALPDWRVQLAERLKAANCD